MDNFKFTDEQQKVVDYILEQVALGENGKNVVISGRGGVGKTTMVCELICILLEQGYKVAAGCMTGKATGVLRKKIYDNLRKHNLEVNTGALKIDTISKMTKRAKVLGSTETGETLYSNTWIDPEHFDYDVLIIDELSMVPSYISLWWAKTKCRVIGLGDFCQIPEVTTDESKKELAGFRHDLKVPATNLITQYGIKVLKNLATFELTEVLRSTGDITLLCNELRDFSMKKNEVKSTIKKWANKSEDIDYSTSLADLEIGDDWQIIAYTNKQCKEINDKLAIGSEYPDLQDKILLFDNLNPIGCYNGEVYKFNDILSRIDKYNNEHTERPVFVVWKFNNCMPKPTSKYEVERMSFATWTKYNREAKLRNIQKLASVIPSIESACHIGDKQKETYIKDVKSISNQAGDAGQCFAEIVKKFEEVDLDMAQQIVAKAPESPRIYFVNIGMGYCCTTHKSQGSEYDKVCYLLEKMDKPLLYTGCSRAKKKLKVIDLTK